MIFIGDIAVPKGIEPQINKLPEPFRTSTVIGNLEGAIVPTGVASTNETKVFNGENVISFLKNLNVRVVSLGNNHITDVPEAFQNTKEILDKNGIARCGAGDNLEEASKAAIINIEGEQYAFLSFGWDVISCKYATDNSAGCNPLSTEWVMKSIADTRILYPNAKIIVLPHWDYELELYPQPMHRELARLMIDAGASGVFGHHPHCAQGIEFYKDVPIVYSVGNWFIPDGVFFDKRLKFPSIAKSQLAIEWNGSDLICHWFEYKPEGHKIIYIESVPAKECQRIKELTPYAGMDNDLYINWFKQNRRKKKGLPIYKNANSDFQNKIKTKWVIRRQQVINLLLTMNLKKGPK